MICLYSGKWLLWSVIYIFSLSLRVNSYTFPNTSTVLVVIREQDDSTSSTPSNLVPDSVPELPNCTYANASSNCCHDTSTENEYFRCFSLTEALDELTGMENISSVAVILGSENSTTFYTLNSYYQVSQNLVSVALVGFGDVTVVCGIGGKLLVNNSQHLSVLNLRWDKCGINSSQPLAAFTVIDCPTITFNNTHFLNGGTSALMVSITQVLHTTKISFTFSNCSFSRNGNYLGSINGAGVQMQLTTLSLNELAVNFKDCRFTSNQASFGGAVYVAASSACGTSEIVFSHCDFLYNLAESHGGAVYSVGTSSLFENCTFIGNRASNVAGAVYLTSSTITSSCQLRFRFSWCLWDNNTAGLSAALYTSTTSQFLSQTSHLTQEMINCKFTHNYVDKYIFNGEPSCIISAQNIDAITMENVLVAENNGSGVCLTSSYLQVQENLTICSNVGYQGGGMFVDDSFVALNPQANLYFMDNKATSGGALYQNGFSGFMDSSCIIVFVNQTSEAKVYFTNNTAIAFGDSVYLTDPQVTCDLTGMEFVYQPNTASQIASSARQVVFLDPDQSSGVQNLSLNLILGQNIIVHVQVLDYFSLPSQVETVVTLFPENFHGYYLQGIRTITLENGVNNLNMYVKGPNITTSITDYELLFLGKDVTTAVHLVLNPCPAGFEYDLSNKTCSCVLHPDIVECNEKKGMACIKQGYWVGEYENTTQYVTAPCTSESCANANQNCSDCMLDSNTGLGNICALPSDSSDQCLGSRTGFICSLCNSNYSFTFGGTECALSSTCQGALTLIVPLVDIIFLIVTVFILIILLKLGYRISSGYLFSFVYYFSIISYLLPSAGTGARCLKIIVSIFQSVTQLTPKFLGYAPICFHAGLTPLELQAILYLNPFLVSLAILLLLALSRYCSVLVQFSDNTPVRAICLLLLLSFTAITTTTFSIINPTYISGVNGTFVFIQPTTSYLDANDHLLWLVIAILVLVVLVIPFTLFLLVSPFLVRCFNLNKIKPFLDEFQGCYKDRFRWMAAYYFICRLCYIVYLTTPAVTVFYVQTQYVVQLMSFFFLMIHVIVQPYQSWLLNLIDTIILADIALVSLLYGQTADIVFQDIAILRAVLAYILVFIPILYMLASSLFGLREMFLFRRLQDWYIKRYSPRNSPSDIPDTTVITISEEKNSSRSNSLREPLLSLLAEDEIQGPRRGHSSTVRTDRAREFMYRGRKTSYTVVDRPWSGMKGGSSSSSDKLEQNHDTGRVSNTNSNSRVRTASSQDWQDHDIPQEIDEL